MKRVRMSIVLALVIMLAAVGVASAQNPAYTTQFITSITYQNVGSAAANVVFQFYPEGNATPITVQRTLNQGAGSSLFVGGLTGPESLPANFLGSAVMSSNQPVVATLVQIPQSTTVKNRPLSNGFSNVTSNVLLATVLKNQFNTTSKFSIQNADSAAATVNVTLVPVSGASIALPAVTLPPGAARYFDMGTLPQVAAATFNGSAKVTATKAGDVPANIVGSVVELSTNNISASAFEGVAGGATTVYMATALCDVFGGATTAYAVQNVGNAAATATVTYQPGNIIFTTPSLEPNAKFSVIGCNTGLSAGFSGSATITSAQPIVVIGKVFNAGFGGYGTAFLGEPAGAPKLALPYVRYTNDANFASGSEQRAFIAIQNVGAAAVANVTVEYRDKNGTLIGTHTIPAIAPGAKANSNATLATGDAAKLLNFGNPPANPGGGFGGSAIVNAPGGQIVAVVRINTMIGANTVAEDYNGIAVQ